MGNKKLLITGFDPFGGETINPSWEAVRRLPDCIGELSLIKMQIPTKFGYGAEMVLKAAQEQCPDVILAVGQAGGRNGITPEVVAINLREASIADNAGYQPQNEPIIPGGPDGLFATVAVRDMVTAIRKLEIPAALSYSAGAFVCNDVLYTLLHHYAGTSTQIGFIHVPFLPEQVKEGVASLPLEKIVTALTAAIAEI